MSEIPSYKTRVFGTFGDDMRLRLEDPTSRTVIAELVLPVSVVVDALRGRQRHDAELAELRWLGLHHYGQTHERKPVELELDEWSQAALDSAIRVENRIFRETVDDTFVPFVIRGEKLNSHRITKDGDRILYKISATRFVDPPRQLTIDDVPDNGASMDPRGVY